MLKSQWERMGKDRCWVKTCPAGFRRIWGRQQKIPVLFQEKVNENIGLSWNSQEAVWLAAILLSSPHREVGDCDNQGKDAAENGGEQGCQVEFPPRKGRERDGKR
jgi:hypothetical protein